MQEVTDVRIDFHSDPRVTIHHNDPVVDVANHWVRQGIPFPEGEVDVSGEPRPARLSDGWWVVGRGYMFPCRSQEEAEQAAWGHACRFEFKLLETDAKAPTKAHPSDQGWDLHAYPRSTIGRSLPSMKLAPHETANVYLGVSICVPEGWAYSLRGRSSLNKKGIQTLLGTADAWYTGPLFALMYNGSDEWHEIRKGDRVAQVVFERAHRVELREVKEFKIPNGARGERGFGSSGR